MTYRYRRTYKLDVLTHLHLESTGGITAYLGHLRFNRTIHIEVGCISSYVWVETTKCISCFQTNHTLQNSMGMWPRTQSMCTIQVLKVYFGKEKA